jgi:poly-beta-hydroxyalkanoate depolymerase
MLYAAYQAHSDMMGAVRAFAGLAGPFVRHTGVGMPGHGSVRNLTAAYELIARAGLTHSRRPYGITPVSVGNREVEVREEAAHVTPFGTLLHFKKDIEAEQPRVLLVRRCRAISPRCCAAPSAPCCPSTTSTSPTGTTCATFRAPPAGSASTNMSNT